MHTQTSTYLQVYKNYARIYSQGKNNMQIYNRIKAIYKHLIRFTSRTSATNTHAKPQRKEGTSLGAAVESSSHDLNSELRLLRRPPLPTRPDSTTTQQRQLRLQRAPSSLDFSDFNELNQLNELHEFHTDTSSRLVLASL